MSTKTEEVTCWLQKYKEWGDNDPITDTGVFSYVNATHYDILCNFDFGYGKNILHIALQRNHPKIIRHLINVLPAQDVKDLLNRGNKFDKTAIYYAAIYNRHEMLTEILSSVRAAGFSSLQLLLTPDSDGYTAARCAARHSNYQVMESMLESLTDSGDRLRLLLSRTRFSDTVLHIAATQNNIHTIRSVQKYVTGDHWYQLMKAHDHCSSPVLHWAALKNNTEMVRILMDPLTAEQQLEMLEMRDIRGRTAKEEAVWRGHTLVPDLLEEITATVTAIRNIKETTAQGKKLNLSGRLILNQPLSTQQLQELFPHSDRYVIPHNQQKAKQHAIILYNQHDRPGADEEAVKLSGALDYVGCDVIKQTWSCVRELQKIIIDGLQPIRSSCSFLMVCLMSHGSMGCLQGDDGEEIAINTILRLLTENLPVHAPLVILIQACAGSRYGIKLQSTVHTDPAVAGASISMEDKKVDLVRPHTLLLQASSTGDPAYRGKYTGCIADQIRQANDTLSIIDMERNARLQMRRIHKLSQVPKMTSTLMGDLILPGKSGCMSNDLDHWYEVSGCLNKTYTTYF